ncbi:pro-interleukin-16-like [Arapaima gigas]
METRSSQRSTRLALISKSLILCSTVPSDESSDLEEKHSRCWLPQQVIPSSTELAAIPDPPEWGCRPRDPGNSKGHVRKTFNLKGYALSTELHPQGICGLENSSGAKWATLPTWSTQRTFCLSPGVRVHCQSSTVFW